MRGGRNKFGPMYKRDRARKLQIMRQRQLAVQALRAAEGNTSQLSPTGYQQPYSNMSIKQEIQIPQVISHTFTYMKNANAIFFHCCLFFTFRFA